MRRRRFDRRCTDCRRPVLWKRTTRSWVLLDAVPNPDGTFIVFGDSARHVPSEYRERARGAQELYTAHTETCSANRRVTGACA